MEYLENPWEDALVIDNPPKRRRKRNPAPAGGGLFLMLAGGAFLWWFKSTKARWPWQAAPVPVPIARRLTRLARKNEEPPVDPITVTVPEGARLIKPRNWEMYGGESFSIIMP